MNFRNYVQEKVLLSPAVNIFFGKNAQGKTNFLEAVYYTAIGRSFRSRKDDELIRRGEDSFFLRGVFIQGEEETKVELGYNGQIFRGKINGNIIKRKIDLFGEFNVVLFSPDDLQLVKGGPQNRREYLDLHLSQVSPKYRWTLYQYYKVIQQRNQLLKNVREGNAGRSQLEVWDENLIDKGVSLINQRIEAVKFLSPLASKCHYEVSGQKEELSLKYNGIISEKEFSSDNIYQIYSSLIKQRKNEEIARGVSLVGPHRDDLSLVFKNGFDLRIYGSQGQQRTASISLKMAMVDFIASVTGSRPILLLDDVLSEFDDHRKNKLLKLLTTSTQTVVTTADISSSRLFGDDVQLFNVEDGKLVLV